MDDRIIDLSKYRMDKANDELETSKIMYDNKKYSQSINRSYYAIFHAVRSLLALRKFDSSKHSGIIAYFNQHYIKSGKIETKYSKILTTAYQFRNDCDYKDFYIITREDAEVQFDDAKKFVNRIQTYLNEIS